MMNNFPSPQTQISEWALVGKQVRRHSKGFTTKQKDYIVHVDHALIIFCAKRIEAFSGDTRSIWTICFLFSTRPFFWQASSTPLWKLVCNGSQKSGQDEFPYFFAMWCSPKKKRSPTTSRHLDGISNLSKIIHFSTLRSYRTFGTRKDIKMVYEGKTPADISTDDFPQIGSNMFCAGNDSINFWNDWIHVDW